MTRHGMFRVLARRSDVRRGHPMSDPYDRGGWGSQEGWSAERGHPQGDGRGDSGGRGSWSSPTSGYGRSDRDDYGRDPYGRPASAAQRYGADDPTQPSSDWDMQGGYRPQY